MDADDDGVVSTSGDEWRTGFPAEWDKNKEMRDISQQAVWSLSSCKPGFGISELLDDSVDRYWQSDGPQPHAVTIEFPSKTDVSFLMIYLDYKTDESYTPSKCIVYLGSSVMHLSEGLAVSFTEPSGWQVIDVREPGGLPARAFCVQLQVVQNHQNGRDTHIRHLRVVGPTRSRFDTDARLLTLARLRAVQRERQQEEQAGGGGREAVAVVNPVNWRPGPLRVLSNNMKMGMSMR